MRTFVTDVTLPSITSNQISCNMRLYVIALFCLSTNSFALNVKELKDLRLKLLKNLQKELYAEAGLKLPRKSRQIQSAEPGAVMYLPLGPGQSIRCPTAADSAAVSLTQMTFLATTMNIFSVVANISNNINNNNKYFHLEHFPDFKVISSFIFFAVITIK